MVKTCGMQHNLKDKSCWQKNKCVTADLCSSADGRSVHFLSLGHFEVKDLLLSANADMEKGVKHGDMAVLHLKIDFP